MRKNVVKFKPVGEEYLQASWESRSTHIGGALECTVPHCGHIEILFHVDGNNQIVPNTVWTRITSFASPFDARQWNTLADGLQYVQDFITARIQELTNLLPAGIPAGAANP